MRVGNSSANGVDTRPALTTRWRALEAKGWMFVSRPMLHPYALWELIGRRGVGYTYIEKGIVRPWSEQDEREKLESFEYTQQWEEEHTHTTRSASQ